MSECQAQLEDLVEVLTEWKSFMPLHTSPSFCGCKSKIIIFRAFAIPQEFESLKIQLIQITSKQKLLLNQKSTLIVDTQKRLFV